jgi:hypothetical protein
LSLIIIIGDKQQDAYADRKKPATKKFLEIVGNEEGIEKGEKEHHDDAGQENEIDSLVVKLAGFLLELFDIVHGRRTQDRCG